MPRIVPLVEGEGDALAVPLLIRRILWEKELWDWDSSKARRAGQLSKARKHLQRLLRLGLTEKDCAGVLLLLDLDDGCPMKEACKLAAEIRALAPTRPVAVILAHREYEAWFLAGVESLVGRDILQDGLTAPLDVEDIRDAKGWLNARMEGGRTYKETKHQEKLTAHLDLELARQNSRSFRRLCHAAEEIVGAYDSGSRTTVSPE